ncbi:GLIPR1-like protein 1 [Amphiura filiformis]|uniref:GLIPR1-like protein 1 n=1 Tax=Amphiura filiformis TaxID=82378 RepID=UPI003B20EA8C
MTAIGFVLLALTSAAVLFSQSNSIENEEFEQKWGVKNVVPDVLGDGEDVKRQATGTIVHFTQAEKDAILNRHNELRGQVSPPAQDMKYMYWDDNEANEAEQWAAACTAGHNRGGQNMWGNSGSLGSPPGGVRATNGWHFEYNWYNHDANSCSAICGHYTQVVWSTTNKVGCGAAFCPKVVDSYTGKTHSNWWIVICNYSPGGNNGRRPYTKGPSCEGCEPGESAWCFENKCSKYISIKTSGHESVTVDIIWLYIYDVLSSQ